MPFDQAFCPDRPERCWTVPASSLDKPGDDGANSATLDPDPPGVAPLDSVRGSRSPCPSLATHFKNERIACPTRWLDRPAGPLRKRYTLGRAHICAHIAERNGADTERG